MKSKQMCTETREKMVQIKANVYKDQSQFSGRTCVKIQGSMSKKWISMPAIQATVPKNQDQGVCCYKEMPETKTKCLVSGLRCGNHGQCA